MAVLMIMQQVQMMISMLISLASISLTMPMLMQMSTSMPMLRAIFEPNQVERSRAKPSQTEPADLA